MEHRKILSLLSLCQKAGRLVTGETGCESAVKSGTAKLVIVCEDASDNTKKKFSNKAAFYEVPLRVIFEREVLNHSIGKLNRTTIAVTDEGFAGRIIELIDGES